MFSVKYPILLEHWALSLNFLRHALFTSALNNYLTSSVLWCLMLPDHCRNFIRFILSIWNQNQMYDARMTRSHILIKKILFIYTMNFWSIFWGPDQMIHFPRCYRSSVSGKCWPVTVQTPGRVDIKWNVALCLQIQSDHNMMKIFILYNSRNK